MYRGVLVVLLFKKCMLKSGENNKRRSKVNFKFDIRQYVKTDMNQQQTSCFKGKTFRETENIANK